ncbi:hypothetical protein L9H26_18855 [Morganella psychrotolerans]|uniref:Uncharacterized protein n=1 Tax=Morganella psychrotolerans TaxID=368603 RepID=A0A5M9QXC7_9GAMM|nr:hypothetical protein [Morganella psychrotolerans]KAA8713070.1 hypothetical protein F4V73_18320 [Morganella psychrotolerans]OBU01934.1 hypothetical protein AYY16_17150 [Morganella psychrotolerans]
MRPNAFSHSSNETFFIDHAALDREVELDKQIEEQRQESRRHMQLKLRIADKRRAELETHKHPSACEKLVQHLCLLDKTVVYSNGTELFTLNKDFSRNLVTL